MVKYARKCDVTGKGMNEGFVFGDGERYFSEEKYLIAHIRSQAGQDEITQGLSDEFLLNEAYNLEEYYYTEWEEVDEDEYYDEYGNEYNN